LTAIVIAPQSDSRRLRRLCWGVRTLPLIKPYELSFAQLTSFEVLWVWAEDEQGRTGIGEAVPLPGYNWETIDSVRDAVATICEDGDGVAVSDIVQKCRDFRSQHPFAASAVMAALDMPQFISYADSAARFPISAPVSGDWPIGMLRQAVERHLDHGYNFIKVKVGRDFDSDAAAARCILTEWPGRKFGVVFDSNQAHSTEAGLAFAGVLRDCASPRLQWYEQPVDRRDWDGMERLCRSGGVPVVLDESIYDEADVARAAAIGAHGIKLKLVKNFGITETLSLARLARELGLIVVFGNGVASDIGNLGEYLTLAAAGGLFAVPSECSGFAKLREPMLGQFLKIDGEGDFVCEVSAKTVIDRMGNFIQATVG
jgi:L-alanine-DL-glutamate epimerase-like enolase superfamily enzyme